MMPDIRMGDCGRPATLNFWVMGIKEVTHPFEEAEMGERGAAVHRQSTVVFQF
jgi:hypothetical protein